MTDYLNVSDLMTAAYYALGGQPPLIRDAGALGAAADRPRTTVFGQDAYPTLPLKAAALLHSIVRNHPLIDGNKRLGWLATLGFLERNGYDLVVHDPAVAEAFVVQVATAGMDVDEASKFIQQHSTARP